MYFELNLTRILTFVIGAFEQNDEFPEAIREMVGLRWLKLDRTGLTEAPEELGKLQKLVGSLLKDCLIIASCLFRV